MMSPYYSYIARFLLLTFITVYLIVIIIMCTYEIIVITTRYSNSYLGKTQVLCSNFPTHIGHFNHEILIIIISREASEVTQKELKII